MPNNFNASVDPNSPLASLYQSEYDFEGLSYPRNLGDADRGHWVNFYINAHNNSMYVKGKQASLVNSPGAAQALQNQNSGSYITSGKTQEVNIPVVNITVPSLTLGRQTTRITKAIALYMPADQIQMVYGTDWNDVSLTEELGLYGMAAQLGVGFYDKMQSGDLGSAVKSLASDPAVYAEALGKFAGGGVRDLALHATGKALNPQIEVLFKGVKLREFTFKFMFSPFSPAEADNVTNIIQAFKEHQAPEIDTSGTAKGRYLIPPSEFDITFVRLGQENTFVPKISTCVLQDMQVNYAPKGVWATFPDGQPVQVEMQLNFKEVEIMTRQRIQQGY